MRSFTPLVGQHRHPISTIELYHTTLQCWFWINDFLNPDKSEAAFIGTKSGLRKPGLPASICVAGCPIAVSERLKILGVSFDSTLSFDNDVSKVVRACVIRRQIAALQEGQSLRYKKANRCVTRRPIAAL